MVMLNLHMQTKKQIEFQLHTHRARCAHGLAGLLEGLSIVHVS